MTIKEKKEVLEANKWIVKKGLVELTWGNVSVIDRDKQVVLIKPSGVDLDNAVEENISELTLGGAGISGLKPSVDTPTHLFLYKKFPDIKSIVHTHSKYCTIFAQAAMPIPCLGTTHADYFYGTVPCAPHPNKQQVKADYEFNTALQIYEHFRQNEIHYNEMGGCLVAGHGVFTWGHSSKIALERAYVLELVAEMAYKTLLLNPSTTLKKFILDKHFLRKHGKQKYYGQ